MKRKKPRIWTWGAVGLFVIALIVCKIVRGDKKTGSAGFGRIGGQAASVEGIVLRPVPLADRVTTTGTVLAEESVDLKSETSGRITQILFQEGTRTRTGDLLVKIEDSDLQAQMERLMHKERLAEDREARQKRMLETGAVSREEYDATLADLEMTRADRRFIEAEIRKTEVRAPFDGTVGLRQVSVGAVVGPGALIATFQNTATVKVEFTVPEQVTGRVRPGAAIRFRTPGMDRWREAKIYAVEPKIEEATRTLRGRARCANPGGAIVPGAFADVEVSLGEIPGAMAVPARAIVPDARGAKVFVADHGRASLRDVQTGLRDSLSVQVTGGLAFGDTVLLTGQMQLRPTAPVRVRLTNP
jgi:membrane fusion protein (multidrug efflux system)